MHTEKSHYPKISIIVLQYNHSEVTLKCLDSLKKLTYPNFEVIIVDNASNTEHLKNIEFWVTDQKLSNFTLLNSDANLGYSGGNNMGIRQALENKSDYILLLNNDVEVGKNMLEDMLRENVDIAGLEEGNIFGFYYLSGAVLLIKKWVFNKIGLLDERYFLYYEDVEFCERAKKNNFTLKLAKTKFKHAISASTKSLGSPALLYYHSRNELLLLTTHASWYIRISLPFRNIFNIIKQSIKIMIGRNSEESKAILQGIKDFQNNKFGKLEN